MNVLKNLLTPITMPHVWQDVLLAIPRVVGCYFLCVNFGMSKFPTPDWFIEDVGKLGLPFPFFFAWAAVLSEVVGAAMMVFGFGTRIAGCMIASTMLVAIFLQKSNSEVWEKLPAMGFLWVSLFAIVLGSGRFGIDYLISKKWR
jgi:putative oxidoreductase